MARLTLPPPAEAQATLLAEANRAGDLGWRDTERSLRYLAATEPLASSRQTFAWLDALEVAEANRSATLAAAIAAIAGAAGDTAARPAEALTRRLLASGEPAEPATEPPPTHWLPPEAG